MLNTLYRICISFDFVMRAIHALSVSNREARKRKRLILTYNKRGKTNKNAHVECMKRKKIGRKRGRKRKMGKKSQKK